MPDRSQKITFARMRGGAGTRRRSLALLNSQSPLLGYFTEREVGAIIERGVLVTVARPGVRQRLLGENGDVTVARRDIPPGHTQSVEVRRLRQR